MLVKRPTRWSDTMNTDFSTLPAPLGALTQDAQTQAEMNAYDAATWRIFYVLVIMLFSLAIVAWGIVS